VLRVAETVKDVGGHDWHKILFAHELLYPERVTDDWYVSAEFVHAFLDDGDHNLKKGIAASSSKRILVDRSEEKLYAYEGEILFMETPISTGLELTPTPRGTFEIFKMTPSRFMQGPIPGVSDQVYDLPGVPWNLYFTSGGAVIHGAYWHDKFGEAWSHGCVNLPLDMAKKLYMWAELGAVVTVRE
jgi:lipoprotein-anchoring transpeptidase ErfK/SrfK